MREFVAYQRKLTVITAALGVVLALLVWPVYGANAAVSFLLGSAVGAAYFRLLGRHVERLGKGRDRLGQLRFVVVAGAFILALRWEVLEFLPTFLGFLTLKVAILGDGLWTIYKDSVTS
ncbi:MAG: ATP synthase subunit I [Gloeobacterales cyanobacterium]